MYFFSRSVSARAAATSASGVRGVPRGSVGGSTPGDPPTGGVSEDDVASADGVDGDAGAASSIFFDDAGGESDVASTAFSCSKTGESIIVPSAGVVRARGKSAVSDVPTFFFFNGLVVALGTLLQ